MEAILLVFWVSQKKKDNGGRIHQKAKLPGQNYKTSITLKKMLISFLTDFKNSASDFLIS